MNEELKKLVDGFGDTQYELGICTYAMQPDKEKLIKKRDAAYIKLTKKIKELYEKAWQYDDLCK